MKRLAILLLFVAAAVRADENTALAEAVADLRKISPLDRPFVRYVRRTDGTQESLQLISLTINYLSRSPVILRPEPIGSVVRIDLRKYAPTDADLKDFAATWEKLAFDPRFSLLLTKDTIRFSPVKIDVPARKVTRWELVPVEPYTHTDGKIYNKKWITHDEHAPAADVVRVVSPHLDPLLAAEAEKLTGSQAAVVSAPYFITRALSTIQDAGLYKDLYSGLYYEFAGIKTGAKKGTDEDVLFEQLGVGDVQSGLTAARIFDKLRSDQRIAIFRSGVTGRVRRADVFKSLTGRESQGLLSVTHDLREQDIDISQHPVMNLLDFKDFAREVIFEKPNGLHGFALFNGAGKRADEVPPDVAADHSIPAPHATRLQPAIGCIRCHGKDSGWRILHNDVKTMLSKGILDVFPLKSTDEIDRIAGLYAGDLERKVLPRGRDDYNSAVLAATGPWAKGKKDQTEVVRVSAEALADLWARHRYDTVDAHRALIELGVKHEAKDAVETLRKLVRPVPVVVVEAGVPRVPIDPRVAALLSGLSINRTDMDLIFSSLATAARKGAAK